MTEICGYFTMRQQELEYYPEFAKKHNLRYEPDSVMPECSTCKDGLDELCKMRNDDLFIKEKRK